MKRALLAAAALLLAGGAADIAATPIARTDLPWWRARHEAKLAEIRRGPVDLLWLGDSITENWEKPEFRPVWQRFYGDRRAIDLGFKGDTTASLLWRITHGEVDGVHPRAAVVLIGANNLGRVHWSAAQTVDGIAAILAELRRRLPDTSVLLLGVLPSERSDWATRTTGEINAALAARYGAGGPVTFVDVGPLFYRDGRLDRGAFYDPQLHPPEPPLHPTPEMMARIAEAIEPQLAAMLGDRRH